MTIYEILLVILVIVVSIIAIRISFKFDINRYLENRREIKISQLKNICPHTRIVDVKGNQIELESLFSSPMGTPKWICSQCGLIVNHEDDVNRITERYRDPSLILKMQKKFNKEAKKLKII